MGRLPISQLPGDKDPNKAGRDHNKNAICTWMAGGGVKQGFVLGTTDELGFAAVENRVAVEDWHATILHLLGLHHEHLFIERNGLNERLTGVTPASPGLCRRFWRRRAARNSERKSHRSFRGLPVLCSALRVPRSICSLVQHLESCWRSLRHGLPGLP